MIEDCDETIERVHFDEKVLTFKRVLSNSSNSDEKNEYLFSLTQFQDEASVKEREEIALSALSQTFQTSNIKGNLKLFSLFNDVKDLKSPQMQSSIIEMLEQNGFASVELIGLGAFGVVFKARNKIRNEIVALKIQILQGEQADNDLMEEGNLAKYLSRRVADSFKSKALSIYSKIVIQDLKSNRKISILEMELAKCSLRDIILRKRQSRSDFTQSELRKICSDLLENLFYIHVNNVAHFDIKPENVLYLSLNDSYILADFGVSEEMKKLSLFDQIETELKGTPLYMSPILRKSYNEGAAIAKHNPFKSDIYSLGLIFFEMLTVKNLSHAELKEVICREERAVLEDLVRKNPFYLNGRYAYIVDRRLYQLPNLLELMLKDDERDRKSIVELCLVCNLEECILSQVLTPFSDIFRPLVSSNPEGPEKCNCSKHRMLVQRTIKYVTRPVIYEGGCLLLSDQGSDERYERHGFGILYRTKSRGKGMRRSLEELGNASVGQLESGEPEEKVVIYEGSWKNDLPDGQGTLLIVADTGYKYKGDFKEGRLHGVGSLFHEGLTIRSGEWFANISNEFQKGSEEWVRDLGYYKMKPDRYGRTVLKFFKLNGNRIIVDICDAQGPCRESVIHVMNCLGRRFTFLQADYRKDCEQKHFRKFSCDMLSFSGQDRLKGNEDFQVSFLAKKFSLKETRAVKKETASSLGGAFQERSIIVELLLTETCGSLVSLKIHASDLTDESFKDMMAAPSLSRIARLYLIKSEKLSDSTFQSISFSQFSTNLTLLDFLGLKIDDEALRIMSSAKSGLKGVTSLKLARCSQISDKGVKYIAASENFKNLRTLSLESTLVTCRTAEEIASSKFLKGLVKINFCHCIRMGDQGIKSLMNSENFRNVRILNIGFTHFNDSIMAALGASKFALAVESLNIKRIGKLTKDCLIGLFCANKALSKSLVKFKTRRFPLSAMCLSKVFSFGMWSRMKVLCFSKCDKLNSECMQVLCNDSGMTNLERLEISYTKVTDSGLQYLAESKVITSLRTLYVTSCPGLKDSSIALYLRSANGAFLENLKINKNNFSDAAMFALAGLEEVRPSLRALRMKMCSGITENGLEFLLRAEKFPCLSHVDFSHQSVTGSILKLIGSSSFAGKLQKLQIRQVKGMDSSSLLQLCDSVNLAKENLIINKTSDPPPLFSIDARGTDIDCSDIRQGLLKDSKPKFLENIVLIDQGAESSLRYYINQEGRKQAENKSAPGEIPPLVKTSSAVSLSGGSKTETAADAKELVSDEVLKSLANSDCLRDLNYLNLARCGKITDAGVGLIFNSNLCKSITKVDISETNLSDNSLKCLASSKSLVGITELNLSKCEGFSLDGLAFLLTSEKIVENLSLLDLRVRVLPPEADAALVALTEPLSKFKRLRNLLIDFSGLQFKESSFKRAWNNLQEVALLESLSADFARCSFNENHCEHIAQALQKLKGLKSLTLNLSECNLKPESTKILAKALNYLNLNYLNLNLKTSLFWKTIRRKQKKEFETIIKRMTNSENQVLIKV